MIIDLKRGTLRILLITTFATLSSRKRVLRIKIVFAAYFVLFIFLKSIK